jgi:hypothetical protein
VIGKLFSRTRAVKWNEMEDDCMDEERESQREKNAPTK